MHRTRTGTLSGLTTSALISTQRTWLQAFLDLTGFFTRPRCLLTANCELRAAGSNANIPKC